MIPVQAAGLIFSEAEQALGGQLLKLAEETDRIEGYTEPHAVLMARLAEMLGKHCGLHGSDLTAVMFATLAHDVGERVMKREISAASVGADLGKSGSISGVIRFWASKPPRSAVSRARRNC